jgi:hypothetical protein
MENLRIEDLSVGDWVQAKMTKWDYEDLDITPSMKVVKIEKDCVRLGFSLDDLEFEVFVEDLQPIPITAEVLEKNGLEQNSNCLDYRFIIGNIYCSISKGIKCWYVNIYDISNSPHTPIFKAHIIHIHELQHALRLAKVEKEIVL